MIISRQLQEKQELARGKEILKIKQLIRTGRSCTAVCINAKGIEEKLTITDMWNQKISIVGFDKKKEIPAIAKQPKATAPIKTVKTKKSAEELIVIVQKVPRANGIATIYYSNQGPIRSSWQRNATA